MPRPLPEGQHARYADDERHAWRVANGDLIAYVAGTAGDVSPFLNDMRNDIRYYGWLTENQTVAARRWMGNSNNNPTSTVTVPVGEATADDAVNILNGDYTLTNLASSMHLSYKIHTVQNGPLAGKRIVKILQGGGAYKGFAFLTSTGHVKVWRRFADDENRNERYVVWSHILLRILREQATPAAVQGASGDHALGGVAHDERWEVQVSTRCRRCNRNLTNPSSIDHGLGPECAARENNRTVAAQQHHVVPDLNTVTDEEVATRIEAMQTPLPTPTVVPEPVSTARIETPEERAARVLAEQTAADRNLPEDDRIRLLARLGSATSGERRERFQRIFQTISYWRRSRICQYCGRSDFETERGCTNHQNNYCPTMREINRVRQVEQNRRAQERLAQQQAAAVARGPNLSQLGTVIGGSVWVQ